jgi:hypothetical protein
MKKLFSLSLITLALLLNSCGGKGGEGTTEGSDSTNVEGGEVNLDGMKEYDLSGSGLNAAIMVADETGPNGAPFPVVDSVILEGISWQVNVGEKYSIVIEEADGSGKYVAAEKKRLNETGIYDLKYEVDQPNCILYEASLKGGAGSKPFYHVFGVVKLEGKDFTIRSNPAGEFNKGQAEKMLKTIQALLKKA